jgi:hypothetical protein
MIRALSMAASLLLLPALAGSAQAQTYTIKFRSDPAAGKSATVRDAHRNAGTVKVLDAGGKLLREQKPNEAEEEAYTETVLEAGGKHPKKYQRVYEKAQRGEAGKLRPRSYQGRTVLFELRDGQYVVRAVGTPALAPADLKDLTTKANDQLKSSPDELFLPKKPVAVGDSWDADKKLLPELARGDELDLGKSAGRAKLLKAYAKDGKQFGVIEVDLKLAVKTMQGLTCDPPARFNIKGTIDTAIDGSSTAATMTMTFRLSSKAQVEQDGMKFTVEMSLEGSGKLERSAEK